MASSAVRPLRGGGVPRRRAHRAGCHRAGRLRRAARDATPGPRSPGAHARGDPAGVRETPKVRPPPTVAGAYAHCEVLTRRQAANFYYGIRLLPRERRRAMCAAYAFARRVDDIGDGTLAREEKLRRLEEEARALAELERSAPTATDTDDPVMVALADAYARFSLPAGALGELIEGVRMDVDGVTYERFEELVTYCRRVAGAIGRVCLAIFGPRDEHGVNRAAAEAL